MNYDVYSLEWEYEDKLPETLTDIEYDHLYPKSEIRSGVRMFPFITVYLLDRQLKEPYLGT